MDERKSYEDQGFVLQRAFLSPGIVQRLVRICERVHGLWLAENAEVARQRDLVNSAGLTATRYFGPPFEAERALFFDALADDDLVPLVTEVFGEGLHFNGTQMFFNPLGGRRRPYWHRDIQYNQWDEAQQRALLDELCHLHLRLPLRPERNFMIVPGSHSRWDSDLEREVRLELGGHQSHEELPSATALDLYPGDVLVFSAHMLHRGTYEGNGARLSLDFMLGRAHSKVPVSVDPDQVPTPDELARLRHPSWYWRTRKLLQTSGAPPIPPRA